MNTERVQTYQQADSAHGHGGKIGKKTGEEPAVQIAGTMGRIHSAPHAASNSAAGNAGQRYYSGSLC